MTRKRRTPETPVLQRFDEANAVRLGLISIQERIPEDHNSWRVEYVVDGRRARLTCDALPQHGGVPHGLDNDVSLALITLYLDAGSPEDGTFSTTAYQILKVTGLDTSGYYYNALRASLDRLSTASYSVSEAWRSGNRWTTVRFRYIDRLEFTSDDDRLQLSGASILRISLAREIVQSVRARYIKPINLSLLSRLQRPLTRALYRLLDAQRAAPDAPAVLAYEVNIIEWAQACKIVDLKPAKVKRTLEGAHAELVQHGYLRGVTYEGRGVRQTIRYEFMADVAEEVAEPATVAQLTQHGVTPTVARQLVRQYGAARVEERLERYHAILANGYSARNRAALLVDVVRDEEGKYGDPAGFVSRSRREHLRTQQEARARATEQQLDAEAARREASWQDLPLVEQTEQAMKTVMVMFGKRLSTQTLAHLRDAMLSGQVTPGDLVRRTTRAAMELGLEDLAEELTQASAQAALNAPSVER
ncbi:replication initiator protein A [Deinococcus maricopensis]|uniref:Replication initiator protein A n=1 Tax=Deinococcus maricopensis (strain DSM 21211 / LMG 22137 / NRRL B-23946 / LB-34) TaxID=709986 RepID=E8U376_DEIML|nr:replication initiator protein A [Deinococcus maricopensis]ADV66021.1 Replication initiator protein A [Deinococcus maricopensis DSM 21211]